MRGGGSYSLSTRPYWRRWPLDTIGYSGFMVSVPGTCCGGCDLLLRVGAVPGVLRVLVTFASTSLMESLHIPLSRSLRSGQRAAPKPRPGGRSGEHCSSHMKTKDIVQIRGGLCRKQTQPQIAFPKMSSSNSFDLSSNSGAANIPTLKTADNRLAKTRSFAAWASNRFVGMCRDVSGCLSTKMLQGGEPIIANWIYPRTKRHWGRFIARFTPWFVVFHIYRFQTPMNHSDFEHVWYHDMMHLDFYCYA